MAAGATYEPIATTTLGTAAASITFSSITSAYTDLRLIITFTPSAAENLRMQLNSDTGSNYSNTRMFGVGAGSGGTSSNANFTSMILHGSNSASTTNPSFNTIDLFSYAGSTNKTILTTLSADNNGSGEVARIVGLWRNTAAITTIYLFMSSGCNLNTGTTATLYGIKNA